MGSNKTEDPEDYMRTMRTIHFWVPYIFFRKLRTMTMVLIFIVFINYTNMRTILASLKQVGTFCFHVKLI